MPQVLHIFRKDTRQFWPEILATLLITAAFIWVYPYQWLSESDPRFLNGNRLLDLHHLQILANTVTALLPISWFFLIARVIHAENLIGNRQFWLTRPYNWKSLLAEKFFFLAVFLYLPFVIAQLALLARAGFSPFHYLPGLLYLLLLTTGIVVLPIMAFSTAVSTIQRMLLILLGVCALIAGIAFLASSSPSSPSLQTPFSDRVSLPVVLAVCFGVLVTQYSGRRLWLARALLLILIPTIALIAANPLEHAMFERAYPAARLDDSIPIHAQLTSISGEGITANVESAKQVTLRLPIDLTGIPRGQKIKPDDITLTIDAADGSHFTAPWQAVYNPSFLDDRSEGLVSVQVDRAFFERVQSKPVQLHVALALTQLAAGRPSQTVLSEGHNFKIPDFGICSYEPGGEYLGSALDCRFPLHQPITTAISAPLTSTACNRGTLGDNASETGLAWIGGNEQDPADFGLTPVWTTNVYLNATTVVSTRESQRIYLCPGTPVTFTPYHLIRRSRFEFAVPNIQLPAIPKNSSGILLLR
jgi:ABC-type transport system involved in multi-copper enzyme maturation permease subunit